MRSPASNEGGDPASPGRWGLKLRGLDLRGLGALALLALALRLRVGLSAGVIARDGIGYLETARLFAEGEWGAGFTRHTAPGFPLALGLCARLLGRPPSEELGVALSALAGALGVVLLGLLAGRASRRAGRLAALAGATSPLLTRLGGEVLSESLFVACLLGSVLALTAQLRRDALAERAPLGVLAGALAGAAYLVRPEGVLLLGVAVLVLLAAPRPGGWRRRLADAGWALAPALLVVALFAWTIRDHAVLGGSQGGAWKLTLKRNLSQYLSGFRAERAAGNLGAQLLHLGEALLATSPLLLAAAAGWRQRAR
ncbi:MAG TPA: hypothetical protein DEA08_14510, partial [Planctomycetes bacterium]|nr:hypothetical protein [Planctomycetota bacterium]